MKYFVVSDIHSFAKELKQALRSAGFDKRNKNHTLIVCGDVFDRGSETMKVYKFLSSIPKKRCILIRGNHELLFNELVNKNYPESHDFHNHTVDSMCEIACRSVSDLHRGDASWKEITDYVKNSAVYKWLNSKQWVNYYELGPYIFVHSFLPVKIKEEYKAALYFYGPYNLASKVFDYREDWRNCTDYEWEEATWGDPIDRYKTGLFKPESEKGKILVVGHWHVSDFWARLKNIRVASKAKPITNIYYSKDFIGLDCGVFYSPTGGYVHPQNVLVFDSEDFNTCYDQYGKVLNEEPSH